jgi:hypothetical protein
MRAGDPEHVALARPAQDLLDRAHAVDAVRRCPSALGRSVLAEAAAAGSRGANGTPALSARSIMPTAIAGPSAPPSRRRSLRERMIGAADHGGGAHVLGHISGTPAAWLVGPVLGQVQPAIDEGMPTTGHVGGEHADLAVGDLAGRAGVLPLHAAGGGALLEKAGRGCVPARPVAATARDRPPPRRASTRSCAAPARAARRGTPRRRPPRWHGGTGAGSAP